MIEIKNLTKRFKDIVAVNDISLDINDGEIFGLLGPNGAGKSTLIHLLSTIIKPDSGTAIIDGYDIIKEPFEVRKRVCVSFQDPKLDWQLNLVETLKWHGKLWRVPKFELNKRIEDMVKSLNLKDVVNKKNWKLSGGTRKKVEVAKVLVVKPKIAIFDEPTAFLDPMMKKIIWDFIKELKENGSTIIIATNLMKEADELSDRVAIMDKGKIITVNSPSKLKSSIQGGEIIIINILSSNKIDVNQSRIISELYKMDDIIKVDIENINNSNEYMVRIFLNNAKN